MKSDIIHHHWIPNGSLNTDTHSNSRTINHYIKTSLHTFLNFQICEFFWSFGLQGHGSLYYIINCKTLAKMTIQKSSNRQPSMHNTKRDPYSSKASNTNNANIFFQSSFAVLWLVWCVCYWFFRHYVWEQNIWF